VALDGTGDTFELAVQAEQAVGPGGQISSTARAPAVLAHELRRNVLHDPFVELAYDGLVALVIYQDIR
jgi:hypothetical protein